MRTRTLMTGALVTVVMGALALAAPALAADMAPSAVANGSVAAGLKHSCAVTAARTVKCWGDNTFGQLGTGDFDSSVTARTVSGLVDVTSVVAAMRHTCAMTATGEVWCWGDNGWGQLGDGSGRNRTTPVRLGALSSVVQISARDFTTCALTSTAELFCWGRNVEGELGVGDRSPRYEPARVVFPNGVRITQVSAGSRHTCAVSTVGEVWCWGSATGSRLGVFDGVRSLTPVKVVADIGTDKLVSVAAGWAATCTLNVVGEAYCFGTNSYGGLGDGRFSESPTPAPVVMPRGVTVRGPIDMSEHFCMIGSDDKVYCFGRNDARQAASLDQLSVMWATPVNTSTSATATFGDGVQALTVGTLHSCALLRSGDITCWGSNDAGQLGDGNSSPAQPPVRALDVVGAQQLPPQAPIEPPAVAEPAPVTPVMPTPDQHRQIDEVVLTPPVTDSTSTTGIVSEQSSAPQAGVPQAAQVATQQVSAQKPKVLRLRVGSFLVGRDIARRVGFTYKGPRIASATMLVPKGQRACTTVSYAIKGLRAGTCKLMLLSIGRNGARTTQHVEVKVVKTPSTR
jgi:alpha-tubulin suppressor-like RCC1 family protein